MSLPYQMQYAAITRRLINHPKKIGDSRIGKINSRFCEVMRIDLTKEFPLQTIKKVKPDNIIHELIWMLKGDSNIRYLVKNNCHIWTDDAYRYYKEKYAMFHLANRGESDRNKMYHMSKEEFVEACLANESMYVPTTEQTYKFGDLDKIYGRQWRSFNGKTDQFNIAIEKLKTNPDDRRIIVTGHNPTDIEENEVGLPSCHNYMQFYTVKLTATERTKYFPEDELTFETDEEVHKMADERGYPSRKLSTYCNIRSNDWFLGQPYNAAQYALLTHIIASIVDMEVDELVINSIDAHLYHAHFDAANEWLNRYERIMDDNHVGEQGLEHDWFELFGGNAKVQFTKQPFTLDDITADDIEINEYESLGFIRAPLLT